MEVGFAWKSSSKQNIGIYDINTIKTIMKN